MSDPTRNAAFDLLDAVLERHRPLEEALDALDPGIPARDRAAAHRLAATVLRRLGTLDAVLEPFLQRAPPEPVRTILRLGAAGLILLQTPAHAAVGTAVELARGRKLAPFAGLVNAVLRRVAAGGAALLDGLDTPRLDTPPWLWASWGPQARAIAIAHQQEAPLDISVMQGADPGLGSRLPGGSWRLPAGTRVAALPGYDEGWFWVQDAAAAWPVRLLAPLAGESVADLCAAPGGKTAQLAAAGAAVCAVERDGQRMQRLQDNLARLRLSARLVQADVLAWAPAERFDAVLLDAPCSATGTIRRHPDVARLKRPADITSLATTQDRLLDVGARLLKPGGRLVYAVCSLQPEEAEPRVQAAAARTGLVPQPFDAVERAFAPEAFTSGGWLRTHPGLWPELGGMDGFFAARLRRP